MTELQRRITEGFDFRCLFLDPRAPKHVLSEEHEDEDFAEQLRTCVRNAVQVLYKSKLDPDRISRAYNNHRQHEIVVVDNAVMFAPVDRDANGRAKRLTKCHFEVVDAGSPMGEELLNQFLSTWEKAAPLTEAAKGNIE